MRGEEMKKPLPYRWQADDPFLGTLNDAQDLDYRRLMDSCWLNWGIPKEMAELATICRFSPAKDFEKAVWFKLEEKFCAWHGKFQSVYLDQERERLAGISAAQSKRAKRPRKKPPANGRLAPGKPAVKEEKIVFGPIQPTASPRITPGIPAAKKLTEIQEALASDIAAGEPPASPRLIESGVILHCNNPDVTLQQKETLTIPAPEPDKENVSRETLALVTSENSPRENSSPSQAPAECLQLDRYFDPLEAWEKFCAAWPQEGLIDDQVSKEWFWKEIVNPVLYKRLVRAAERYLASLPSVWQPIDFIIWTAQWVRHED